VVVTRGKKNSLPRRKKKDKGEGGSKRPEEKTWESLNLNIHKIGAGGIKLERGGRPEEKK